MKKILFFLLMMILFSSQTFAAKYIALTFDDGPNATYTPQVLDILKKNNIQANFFVLGQNAQKYPDLIKQEIANGNEIGNHSFSHPYFTKIGDQKAFEELEKTNQILEKITGQKPKFYRPPYGLRNEAIIEHFSDQTLTMRNIEGMDRTLKTSQQVEDQILKNIKPNGIILIHDIHPRTLQALEPTIQKLKSQGYEFITLSQLQKISPSSFDPANAKYIPDMEKQFIKLPFWFRNLYLKL